MSAVEPTLTDLERERLAAAWSDETGSAMWQSLQNTVARMLAAARADERERLTPVRRYVESRAITAYALGEDQRPWLDLLILLDRAALTQPADTKAADR